MAKCQVAAALLSVLPSVSTSDRHMIEATIPGQSIKLSYMIESLVRGSLRKMLTGFWNSGPGRLEGSRGGWMIANRIVRQKEQVLGLSAQ